MSRSFWVIVGAAGGIVAYRRATRLAARSKELGALGTAQAAAATTSRLAGGAAAGIGRVRDVRDRRAGRLVTGALVADADPQAAIPAAVAPDGVRTAAAASRPGATVDAGAEDVPADWVSASEVRRAGVGRPVVIESDVAARDDRRAAQHEEAAARATSRTTRPRRP
jgi:hypothetical protein